jgi:hypothetical protein
VHTSSWVRLIFEPKNLLRDLRRRSLECKEEMSRSGSRRDILGNSVPSKLRGCAVAQ